MARRVAPVLLQKEESPKTPGTALITPVGVAMYGGAKILAPTCQMASRGDPPRRP